MSEEIWFPYEGIEESKWKGVTERLINEFPIKMETIRDIVLDSWNEIFTISNATQDFAIGTTVFPKPQILGFFLEEIVTQKISKLDSTTWVPDPTGYSKDLVNTKEPKYSLEIKTSSSENKIFGNRSYGKKGNSKKKSKDGYYLAINYEQFDLEEQSKHPQINLIRFGYLNHDDWVSQKAETGQQAHLPANVELAKLIPIYVNFKKAFFNNFSKINNDQFKKSLGIIINYLQDNCPTLNYKARASKVTLFDSNGMSISFSFRKNYLIVFPDTTILEEFSKQIKQEGLKKKTTSFEIDYEKDIGLTLLRNVILKSFHLELET